MSHATCETCPWWEPMKGTQGLCRKDEPRSQWVPVDRSTNYERITRWEQRTGWPTVCRADWCGQHPARKEATDGSK